MIDTSTIQRALTAAGFDPGPVDGIVGPMTLAAAAAALRKAGTEVHGDWPGDRVMIAYRQLMMARLGIETGKIDGFMGPQTEYAFDAYDHLLSTGVVPTWRDDLMEPLPDDDRFPDPVKMTFPRQREVQSYYGPVGQNQTMLALPFPMRIAWDTDSILTRFSIHEKVHDSAERVFRRIADAYPDAQQRSELGLDLFGGCLNVRKMRGGSAYSMHSWAIAIDFDPANNKYRWGRDKARLDEPSYDTFWKLWTEEGWLSLGKARNFDWMHVQAARL